MKVTVNFGAVGVIVPCGSGDVSVGRLTELAVTRYKKATGKPSSAQVTVRSLKSCSDGGILDPDDRLGDVADDREQIEAVFDEWTGPPWPRPAAEGTGGTFACVDVEIGPQLPLGAAPLRVRRGSEPALNRTSPPTSGCLPRKRWSAALLLDDRLASDPGLRREPVGGPSTQGESEDHRLEGSCWVVLKNEAGPLGIHVVPDCDQGGRDVGLVVQGIEPGGRIDRDGRLRVSDRIVEINGCSLKNVGFQKAQDIFKEALKAPEIRLCLLRGDSRPAAVTVPKKPPPVYPKPTALRDSPPDRHQLVQGRETGGINTKVATITPTKKIPPIIPHRNPNTALTANTRKIGKKIHIQLSKGSEGLGFSVTTRDNPAGGNCPIYIKNILPKGAAIQDGRLKPGDRLLEVNSVEMTGKSQTEAVSILRNTPLGGTVELVVSRQELDISPSSSLCRDKEMISEKSGEIFWKRKEIFTFEIPLNNVDSNGLGVSVKGKTTTGHNGSVDLGIFVKSVIEDGAAFKDGRLKTNDQLININGISLLKMSNSEAMETLRHAMSQKNGINPSYITLSISRRIQSLFQQPKLNKGGDDTHHDKNASVSHIVMDYDSCSSLVKNLNFENLSTEDNPISNAATQSITFMSKGIKDNNSERKALIKDPSFGKHPPLEHITRPNLENKNSVKRMNEDNQKNWNIQQKLCGNSDTKAKDVSVTTLKTLTGEMLLIENDVEKWQSLSGNGISKNCTISSKLESSDLGTEKTEIKYESQLSLEDNNFCRDGFGRQSISEKRHAQLDAKSTDTYQRNKKAREERERFKSDLSNVIQPEGKNFSNSELEETNENGNRKFQSIVNLVKSNSADSLVSSNQCNNEMTHLGGEKFSSKSTSFQLGPTLGMRKSSSLESLQTMVHELHKREVSEFVLHPSKRVIRGRGCNESFRAAVDRSYEAPVTETMETLEEESESVGSNCQTVLGLNPGSSSKRIGNNSLQDIMINHHERKIIKVRKKGIFKGLGSVFKFGKNKKSGQETIDGIGQEELEEPQQLIDRLAASEEQEKVQDQCRKQQKLQEKYSYNSIPIVSNADQNSELVEINHIMDLPFLSPSRQERMQQLRAHHQRRHQERRGLYPQDEQEEWYEQEIKEKIDRKQTMTRQPLPSISLQQIYRNYNNQRRVFPKRYETELMHSRSQSFDLYKEMERPGSRMGIAADPNKYSHYMNYKEIQQHLRQIQQNQCHTLAGRKERPISNYYEYESTTILPSRQLLGCESLTNSLPRRSRVSNQHSYIQERPVSLFGRHKSSHSEDGQFQASHNYEYDHQNNGSSDDNRSGSKV